MAPTRSRESSMRRAWRESAAAVSQQASLRAVRPVLATVLLAARAGASIEPVPDAAAQDHDSGTTDAGNGAPDAGPPDAGQPDAGPPDAGRPDAGAPDAGSPDAGATCGT